ncbi:hypothetical protein BGX28_003830 [Mortierella sp. GBA30]|nr:hypothetical protein BGX28_003830 [Mortierella sp. GBA30]
MDAPYRFFCLVNGESSSNAFSIKASSTDNVDDLKCLIKSKKAIQFGDVDAEQLILWSVSIPMTEDEEDSTVSLDALMEKKKLHPASDLSDVPANTPPAKTISIVVQRPPKVSSLIRLRVVLLAYRNEFVWTTDADLTTLSDLQTIISRMISKPLDASEMITVQHSRTFTESEQPREPVTSDGHLRRIIWCNIRAGSHDLVVDLETPSKTFSSYTIADVSHLYALSTSLCPDMTKLPVFDSIGSAALESSEHRQTLQRLYGELEIRKRQRYPQSGSINGIYSPGFIYSFAAQAASLFNDKLWLQERMEICGIRGHGPVDIVVASKVDQTHILGITQVKDQQFCNGVAQSMVQLESIARGRTQRFDDTEGSIPVVSYGIVTDAEEWHFVKCKLDSADSMPVFHTSKVPVRVNYDADGWRSDVRKIFERIVWLMEEMVKQIRDNPLSVKP